LVDIAIEACKQKKLEEALRLAENISNVVYKEMTFKEIAFQFALQGDIDGALKITNEIKKSIFGEFSISISKIATILFNCGEFTTCETLMKEAIETIDTDKLFIGTLGHPFGEISIEFAKQKKYDKAIELIEKIPLDKDKIYPLYHISIELEKSGDNELSSDLLDKALEIGLCNIDDSTIYKILPVILKSLEYNKIDHIFFKLKDIYNEKLNAFLFTSIALGCLKLNLNIAARNIYLKSLYLKPKSLETDSISNYKLDLMLHYLKINQHKKSFVIFNEIKDNEIKKKALQSISDYFEKNIRLDNQNYLESIFENYELKILLNLSIIKKLFQFGQLEESYILMQNTLHFIRSITNDENKIKYLIKIANECNDQGRSESMQTILDEAIGLTKNLENINSKIASYFEISVYLLKLNSESWMDFFLEGMTEGDKCNDVVTRLSVLWAAIKLLASNNETQLALKLVDEYSKVSMPPLLLLNQITSEIVRDNLENEAIQIVNAYSKESKDVFIEDLKIPGAINYLKVNNWALVVHTSNSIIDNLKRSNCWESIGNHIKRTDNTLASINKSKDLSNDFSKLYFLRGWSFDIDPTKIDESNLIKVLPFLVKDTEAIENVLQSYALYSLFVAKTPVVQQSRLNRTLNIQWALDIVAQFPKDENIDRLSTNLDEWLHEISDEDDREEIELLTKKVAKGKMTEEEFGDRVRGMG
jgi:hypothetical protein